MVSSLGKIAAPDTSRVAHVVVREVSNEEAIDSVD
jgi:hypothetical protein